MIVELRPEAEALIQKRMRAGGLTAEEVIERALEVFNAEEDLLAGTPEVIAAEIQTAWDEAQRGELADPETARAAMKAFKDHWQKQRSA